jgi:pre-mRNA-splicing helicase BRR2
VLHSYTDEVIAVLKNDSLKDKEKKGEIEGILGPLKDDIFDRLLNLSKQINDYRTEDQQMSHF